MLATSSWDKWVALGTLALASVTVILAAISAVGVWVAARSARDTRLLARTSRAALDASIQPLLAPVPVGEFDAEKPDADVGQVIVKGDGESLFLAVPLRNVGTGVALIYRTYITISDGIDWLDGKASHIAVPVGEQTRVYFDISRQYRREYIEALGDALWVVVMYMDAGGEQQMRTRAVVHETSHHVFEVTRVYVHRGEDEASFITAGTTLRD
jgi:hypothetical protein